MSARVPRPDELEPKLREALRPRVERLGYLGEFFRCAGHAPDVLRHFMAMTEALKQAPLGGAQPRLLRRAWACCKRTPTGCR